MSVIQRIQSLCDRDGITISALEVKLGFSHYSLTEARAKNIRSDRLLQIAQFFNVSTDWLLTGENHIGNGDALTDRERYLIELFRNLDPIGKDMLFSSFSIYRDNGFMKKSDDSLEVKVGD